MTPDPENVGPHDRPSISERLRSATAVAHERAEHAPFIDDLMSGRLDSGEYQRLAVQLYFVYEALERVGADLAGDPVADAAEQYGFARHTTRWQDLIEDLETALAATRQDRPSPAATPLPRPTTKAATMKTNGAIRTTAA